MLVDVKLHRAQCLSRFLNVKAVLAAFNKKKVLERPLSVIVRL